MLRCTKLHCKTRSPQSIFIWRREDGKKHWKDREKKMIKIQWCETNWYKYLMNQKDFLYSYATESLSVVNRTENRSLTSSHQMISNLTFFQLYGSFSILIINDLFCHPIKALLNFSLFCYRNLLVVEYREKIYSVYE